MKTELRPVKHLVESNGERGDINVTEIWYGGKFIGAIYGGEGPSVRIVSNFPKRIKVTDDGAVMEVGIQCVDFLA